MLPFKQNFKWATAILFAMALLSTANALYYGYEINSPANSSNAGDITNINSNLGAETLTWPETI